MKKEMICICCPKGCHLIYEDGNISGFSCSRGKSYGLQEAINPTRIVTSTVRVKNSKKIYVLPVKTSNPIPKDMIFSVMKEINKVDVCLPCKIGDVVIKNVLNLGVNIILTKGAKNE